MDPINDILHSKANTKVKQEALVKAVCSGAISVKHFLAFFESAPDVDKGTCADAMKHITAHEPELLAPHIDILVKYINYPAPRVRWGVPEALGNLAKHFPDRVAGAVPLLLKNAVATKDNTTVIRWCAAYGLSEIARHNSTVQESLLPKIKELAKKEKNNGVRNVYRRALKSIEK
jgi:hypothetical protein